MERRRMKVFGVVMTLLLVFSLAATFSLSSTSTVSAGTQKWTKVNIPDTDHMQLAPGTDVGAIAVSPDGATLFAALYAEDPETWNVTKSLDGGYTWKILKGFTDALNASGTPDGSDVVAIKVSPDWKNDDTVVVATQKEIYTSGDSGKTFTSMGANKGGTISSLDLTLDKDGNLAYMLGNASDVFVWGGKVPSWRAQHVDFDGFDLSIPGGGVLATAFSPNYAQDGAVFAIIRASGLGLSDGTFFRAESDITVNTWGSFIDDAPFMNKENAAVSIFANTSIKATKACMAFANDYSSAPAVFVGLSSNASTQVGDAFRVDLVSGSIGTSAINNLNIRGPQIATNVNSLAVSGNSSSAYILAGLSNLNNLGPLSNWEGDVHYSNNGGESWMQSYKPPSGMSQYQTCAPIVIMAPNFSPNGDGVAYCGNGFIDDLTYTIFSGFYASTTSGTTWNGRGLLDLTNHCITDVVPSPTYENDSTLFMVTNSSTETSGIGLLWETKNAGTKWDLILSMTTEIPVPGVYIDTVRIPATYPQEPSVFVTGPKSVVGGKASSLMIRSTDQGNLFATTIKGPKWPSLIIDAWAVIDKDTIIAANGSTIWKTTDMGAHWTEANDEDLVGYTVNDLQLYNDTSILVGTHEGKVFLCNNLDTDFSFTQVGTNNPGDSEAWMYVAFDTNFGTNGIVYAGAWAEPYTGGVWRINANSADTWDEIYDIGAIYGIKCDGNGILWAIDDNGSATAIRCVKPTDDLSKIEFQVVNDGLTSPLLSDLVTAPTQTYVFAVGGNCSEGSCCGGNELWTYVDTLIKPTLISPACGATAVGTIIGGTAEQNSDAHVTLMWQSMPQANGYDYEIAYDPDFGSLVFSPAITTTEGTQASVNLFLGEKYYWRVRVNGSPVLSQWSDTCSFTTPLGPTSAKPILVSPAAGQTNVSPTTALQWSSVVDATGFELILAKNCDWSTPALDLTGSSALGDETAYQITSALQQGTNYCWKVRALNSNTATNSPWSDTGTFTTLTTPVVTKVGTPVWVWVVIALSAILLVAVVVLIARTRRPI